MTPDAATTSTPAPQATAPGSQPASVPPAPQPTPVQLLWEVATLAFELMRRLVNVLQPIQQYYPKPALLLARLLIDIPRIFLTIRYAPERVTIAQLRHLTRARHILQALFNYTLPTLSSNSPSATSLGPRTSPSATATANQSPSASTENAPPLGARMPSSATTPSPAISATLSPNAPSSATPGARKPSSASATPTIRQIPEIPMVAGVSHVPASSTVNNSQFPPDPSHTSPTSHPSHDSQSPYSKGEDPVGLRDPNPQSATPHSAFRIQHSAFSPYIPDFHTLAQALKADSLPPNCAGALFEEPGDALVRALHQLHAIYFSLYPNQSPSPSPSQSSFNPQSTIRNPQSPSPSSGNLQSSIQVRRPSEPSRPQSGTPQSDTPSVQPVHSVHSASPVQSEISNLKSEIPHSAFRIPHSTAPP